MARQINIIQINKETVIIGYGIQSLCFYNFNDPHKSHFRHFMEELLIMQKRTLPKILSLAAQHEVAIMSSRHKK